MGKRPIKFRAWHKGEAFMIDWDLIVDDGILAYFASDDYELMQYTGLKDRNGREIYEGDLIQEVYEESECGPAVTFVVPVVFMDGAFCIEDGDPLFELDAMNDHNWSAVGNIYENPELIQR